MRQTLICFFLFIIMMQGCEHGHAGYLETTAACIRAGGCEKLTPRQQQAQDRMEMSPMQYEMDMRARYPDLWAAVQRDSVRMGCKQNKPCKGQPPGCRGNHGCVSEEETQPKYFERRK